MKIVQPRSEITPFRSALTQQPGAAWSNTGWTQAQAKCNARAKSSEPQSRTSRSVLPWPFFVSWAAWKGFKTVSWSQAHAPGSQTTPRIGPPSTVKQCTTKSRLWHKSELNWSKENLNEEFKEGNWKTAHSEKEMNRIQGNGQKTQRWKPRCACKVLNFQDTAKEMIQMVKKLITAIVTAVTMVTPHLKLKHLNKHQARRTMVGSKSQQSHL